MTKLKKFMLLFVSIDKPDQKTQRKKGGEWVMGLPKGMMLDCYPFENNAKIVQKYSVSEYKEEPFGGYMIIHAASLNEAIKIAESAPHVSFGGKIVVLPIEDV